MVTYDPADPRWVLDPGPLFDEIRETAPVHFTDDGYWVISRHEDCLAILRNKDASADGMNSDPTKRPDALRVLDATTPTPRFEPARRHATVSVSRPARPYASPRTRPKSVPPPRRVAELTPFIEQRARTIINTHLDSGPFDAVNALAWSLPVSVICEMLDIPDSDHDTFKTQSALLARGLDPEFLLSPEELEARDLAILHFAAYFHELFDQRRQRPGEDLMSALVAARDGGDQLSEGELLSTVILLLVAGHETTMNLISGSLLLLTQDEHAQSTLRKNPELDRTATEEFLRLVAPVQLTGRSLAGDILIDGHLLEQGTFGFLLIAARTAIRSSSTIRPRCNWTASETPISVSASDFITVLALPWRASNPASCCANSSTRPVRFLAPRNPSLPTQCGLARHRGATTHTAFLTGRSTYKRSAGESNERARSCRHRRNPRR